MHHRPLVVVAVAAVAAPVVAFTPSTTARPDTLRAVGAVRAVGADRAVGAVGADVTGRGVALARAHSGTLGLTSDQGLRAKDVVVDGNGGQHFRFDRTFKGLPVVGGDFIVHSDPAGAYSGSDGRSTDVSVPSTTPGVSPQKAAARASGAMAYAVRRSTPKLAVYAVSSVPRLVWQTQVDGIGAHGEPAGEAVFVDAQTGAVVDHWPTVLPGAGTGESLYLGNVPVQTTLVSGGYQMVDPTRGRGRTDDANNVLSPAPVGTVFTDADNAWGDGTTASRQSAAVDAHYGVAATWDFFRKTFGRRGIRNNGVGARSLVHVGTGWVNAAWDDACFCMRYGDGDGATFGPLVSLDATGHEMTHGVTSVTAGLLYQGEPGGLNESTSDVMGTMVEFGARNANDVGDYTIGERFALNGTPPMRFMDRPSKDGVSVDCWSPGVGTLDVHFSSGVGNHLFYLLAEGSGAKTINGVSYLSPTCNRSRVTGIGRGKAAAIWYRALTTRWVSTTSYSRARAGMLRAAASLYGGTKSKEYVATVRAWAAVGVR